MNNEAQPLITARVLLDLLPIVANQQWKMLPVTPNSVWIRNKEDECPICAILTEIGLNPNGAKGTALSALAGALDMKNAWLGPEVGDEVVDVMDAADIQHPSKQSVIDYRAEMIAILNPQEQQQ